MRILSFSFSKLMKISAETTFTHKPSTWLLRCPTSHLWWGEVVEVNLDRKLVTSHLVPSSNLHVTSTVMSAGFLVIPFIQDAKLASHIVSHQSTSLLQTRSWWAPLVWNKTKLATSLMISSRVWAMERVQKIELAILKQFRELPKLSIDWFIPPTTGAWAGSN